MSINYLPDFEVKQVYFFQKNDQWIIYSVFVYIPSVNMLLKGIKIKISQNNNKNLVIWPSFYGFDPTQKKYVKVPCFSFDKDKTQDWRLAVLAKTQVWLSKNEPIHTSPFKVSGFHHKKKTSKSGGKTNTLNKKIKFCNERK